MTISSTVNRKEYTGDGATVTFAFPYYFLADGDLKVYDGGTLQTITTHYTVSGAGNPAGGSVTFLTAPVTDNDVVILRDPGITQSTDWVENDADSAAVKEQAFDRLTMICQRLSDRMNLAMRVNDSVVSSTISTLLPNASDGTVLGWSVSGGVASITNLDVADVYVPIQASAPSGVTYKLWYDTVNQRLKYWNGSSWSTIEEAGAVDFTQVGTGAVLSDVATKLGEFRSAKDFGATGDGVTDDTSAIVAALSAVSGGTLFFPDGDYVVQADAIMPDENTSVIMSPNAWLKWDGSTGSSYVFSTDSVDPAENQTYIVNIDGGAFTGVLCQINAFENCEFSIELTGTGTTSTGCKIEADATNASDTMNKKNCAHGLFHRIVHRGVCGTFIYTTGVTSGIGGNPQVVTLNKFGHIQCERGTVYGLNIGSWTDNNVFENVRVAVTENNSIGVIINSDDPTGDPGVYNNLFNLLAVDTFSTYTGRIGMKINGSKTTKVELFHQDPVAEGGSLVIANSPQSYQVYKKDDNSAIMSVAQTGVISRADEFSTLETAVSIADDAATSFDLGADQAVIIISGDDPKASGLIWVKPKSTGAFISKLAGDATYLETTTGVLSGTTGTDVRFTVSAHTDGKVYLENRLGYAAVVSWTVFSRSDS